MSETEKKEVLPIEPEVEPEVQKIFNRALWLTFSARKLLVTFCVLAFCGLFVVFFRGLAIHAGHWVAMSLTFLPIFLCAGVLLSMGLILIRVYHDEVKNIPVNYLEVLNRSWDVMIGSSYIAIPLILTYLLLWMVLGVFYLLKEIPGLGDLIGVVLAFGPFLLNLCSLLLTLATIGVLFFVTPVLALRSSGRLAIPQMILRRIQSDFFTNGVHIFLAVFPLFLTGGILTLAAILTGTTYLDVEQSSEIILQWFFIMVPFTALLSPAVVFFFNFAAESHVLMQKRIRSQRGRSRK